MNELTPRVVLVHGAFHGASCWDGVVTELARLGVPAAAVELPLTSFEHDVAAARSTIELAAPACVVAGHSYGGAVISEACSGLSNVARLVYLAGLLLEPGEDPTVHLEGSKLLASLVVDESGISIDPAVAADIFYGEADATVAATMVARLRPMPLDGSPVRQGLHPAWRSVPSTYVVSTNDRALPLGAQRKMATRAETVVEWPTDHSPFASRPAVVAALLNDYLVR